MEEMELERERERLEILSKLFVLKKITREEFIALATGNADEELVDKVKALLKK